jgi:glutathione S-transferase
MIIVYGAPPTRALRVIWMLEEMGLDYEIRAVEFANRFENSEFIAASPAGTIPGIKDGEVRMMESVVIMEYLAARHGPTPLAPDQSQHEFPLYQQFLHYGEASLSAPLNVTIASRFFAPEEHKQNWGAQYAVEMVIKRWAAVADQLKLTAYVAGENFTAADISCGYASTLAKGFGFADRLDPVINSYFKRLSERPAYRRASAKREAF